MFTHLILETVIIKLTSVDIQLIDIIIDIYY